MDILKFVWDVIGHPYVAIAALLIVIALAAYGYLKGLPALLKVLISPTLWLAIALVVLSLAVLNLKQDNDSLHKQVATQAQTQVASDAAATVTTQVQKAVVKRQTETNRIQGAITNAQPGQAEDDALDAIAAIQSGGNSVAAPAPVGTDGVLDAKRPPAS